MSIITVFCHKS